MSVPTNDDVAIPPAALIGRREESPTSMRIIGAALIAILALAAYWPALRGEFIWDDELLVTKSNLVKSSDGLSRIWFSTEPADYWPMTNSSFWLEWRLWGANATGYHVDNLLLHIAAALLIWAILRKLSVPGAFLAALLFAVHPVNVESVAWIAQRKNTLAMFFFLLSVLWYLRSEEPRRAAIWYWLSLIAFVLAMLSKGSVAILPALLLGLAWWQRGRIGWWDVARSVPFFLVAIVLTRVNIWFQTHSAELVALDTRFTQRLAGAGGVIWFYLSKALLPLRLMFIYPQWSIQPGDWLWWLPLAAAILVSLVLLARGYGQQVRWMRALLFAWGTFCLALLPVLGFVDVGFMQYSLVADHYQHIAVISVVALAAAGWSVWHERAAAAFRPAVMGIAVVVVGALTFISATQSAPFSDATRFYETILATNPTSWLAHNNLGVEVAKQGRAEDALHDFQRALQFKPEYAEALYNLGNVLDRAGMLNEAVEQYQQALQVKPGYPEVHNNLANAFTKMRRLPEAIEQYRIALQLKPDYGEAHNNLGIVLLTTGEKEAALEEFQAALELQPGSADTQRNVGHALLAVDRPQEAVPYFQAAERLEPESGEAHYFLGVCLAAVDRLPEAVDEFLESLRLQPDRLQPYAKLAATYAQLQRSDEAIATAQKAMRLAREKNQPALAEKIEAWLKEYQASLAEPTHAAPKGEFTPAAP